MFRDLNVVPRWATTFFDRARGCLGAPPAGRDAIVITPAKQVHTFGLRVPIGVIFCDARWVVLHVVPAMKPARLSRFVRGSRYVVELAPRIAAGVVEGDVIVGLDRRVVEPRHERLARDE
ncbi:MAG TPA: hypothetical protein VFK89_03865 [Actinomycetota bacterium]|nr:hypothetical protein [Actinomycetota bacterium]